MDGQKAPGHRLEQQEEARLVRQAINQLAEEFRLVLILRELDGFCYEEIASVLDIPLGTVRSRLCRARMQLKEQLTLLMGESYA
jgi:RNA polymerase sigma-70 factor (ECF subfamily)